MNELTAALHKISFPLFVLPPKQDGRYWARRTYWGTALGRHPIWPRLPRSFS